MEFKEMKVYVKDDGYYTYFRLAQSQITLTDRPQKPIYEHKVTKID